MTVETIEDKRLDGPSDFTVYSDTLTTSEYSDVSSGAPSPSFNADSLMEAASQAYRNIAISHALSKASSLTGAYVKFLPEYGCCPALIGQGSKTVFLYQFVEAMDSLLDFDDLKEEFPSLSYAQIDGAISFLRKISQFNIRGVDIDERIDEEIHTPEFIEELRQAFADKDSSRVLHQD